uniref:Uncharacterized protein n=1 Tax=Candidatus Kentrum sp. LPFa TaxID=2126335 RepID=A0A450W688_9GAMM|nr:MAG: hypothetical protein BECKLPF1236A_GA0070988_1007211 [Candidatus Kentron sp. LPFa]VFK28734.1 MAG: hypothetical protein BECKLPF1236C_GA0070990_1007310 [Candidatus Kentron sp. LPFa]
MLDNERWAYANLPFILQPGEIRKLKTMMRNSKNRIGPRFYNSPEFGG